MNLLRSRPFMRCFVRWRVIDMRSDTVTKPTPEMRKAMAEAVVGDDVFGEDPTVTELENRCARLFGMESALFVPTGTMGNLISIMVHCDRRGSELIVGHNQHIHKYEQAGYAQLAGVGAMAIENKADGTMSLESISQSIRDSSDFHQASTQLICLENTHNYNGGRVLPQKFMSQVRHLAEANGIKVHVDGARLLNASVSSGLSVAQLLTCAHSVSMCFSKAVGAPVGSVIGGSKQFIAQALRLRKAVGGGMRQSGVLAAAAMVALDTAVQRITLDHKNAKMLAKETNALKSELVNVDEDIVESNIVLINCSIDSQTICDSLSENDEMGALLLMPWTKHSIRVVLHSDVSTDDVHCALAKFKRFLAEY